MNQRHTRNGSTRQWRRARAHVLATMPDTCSQCGHPDTNAVDHKTPWTVCRAQGIDPDHPSNLARIHHGPCPTCGHDCNREKGTKTHAPVIRRSGSLNRPNV